MPKRWRNRPTGSNGADPRLPHRGRVTGVACAWEFRLRVFDPFPD
jgi:hypothetical protein